MNVSKIALQCRNYEFMVVVVVACNRVPQLINRIQILSTEQLQASNHTRPVIYSIFYTSPSRNGMGWGCSVAAGGTGWPIYWTTTRTNWSLLYVVCPCERTNWMDDCVRSSLFVSPRTWGRLDEVEWSGWGETNGRMNGHRIKCNNLNGGYQFNVPTSLSICDWR